jgi:hypothetical protein
MTMGNFFHQLFSTWNSYNSKRGLYFSPRISQFVLPGLKRRGGNSAWLELEESEKWQL